MRAMQRSPLVLANPNLTSIRPLFDLQEALMSVFKCMTS